MDDATSRRVVEERVQAVILEYLDAETVSVEDLQKARSMEDLGCDSLDALEIQILLEEEFGFSDPNDDFAIIGSLDDLYQWVWDHTEQTSESGGHTDEH